MLHFPCVACCIALDAVSPNQCLCRYVPDYKETQILQFGRGAGCDFVSSSCWGLLNQGDDEFFCRVIAAPPHPDRPLVSLRSSFLGAG